MQLPQDYYPTGAIGANPIHAVNNWCYVRKLARAAIRGEEVKPFLVDGEKGSCNLLTGTHRAAANNLLEALGRNERIDWVSLEDLSNDEPHIDELREAAAEADYERLDAIWDRA